MGIHASLALDLDYPFLVAFASCLSLACVHLARRCSQRFAILSTLGIVLSMVALATAPFDDLENYALIRMLLGARLAFWPIAAFWAAVLKFLLIGLCLIYLAGAATSLIMMCGWPFRRQRSTRL